MTGSGNNLDIIIIGAGFSGIVFLKYAKNFNYKCLVLDILDDAGGLWKKLPSWQYIGNTFLHGRKSQEYYVTNYRDMFHSKEIHFAYKNKTLRLKEF